MALVASAILGAFTHSPAEKAFRYCFLKGTGQRDNNGLIVIWLDRPKFELPLALIPSFKTVPLIFD